MDKLKNVLVYIAQNGLLSLALTGIGFSALSPLNIIRPVHAESKQSQPKEPVSITTPAVEQVQKQLLNSAVEFEENRGQFDKAVRFVAKAAGSTIFLTADEVVYVLPMGGTDETTSIHEGRPNEADLTRKEPATNTRHTAYAVRMKLVGANPASTYAGEDTAEHRTNYLRGSDESKWQTDVPNHTRVKYNDVYDGIGMVWHGKANGETQYDFVVEPFANVNQIVLEFDGANSLEIDADGNLLVHTAAGTVKQNKPFTYQEENGLQREISSGFIIQDKKVSFALGSYDRSKTLIVDPTTSLNVLSYSTFIGGSGVDNARQIALDGDNNAYVIARTNVAGYPTTSGTFDTTFNGSVDLAVTKLNASGSALVYSTYVGGSGVDEGFDLAVDAAGNVYLAGYTDSTNYPVTANAFDTTFNGGGGDAFVTKLNATGSALLYSSFVGGTGFDGGASLAIDANSNVYLGGSTNSSNFPTTTGAFDVTLNGGLDAFVAKLNTVTPFLFYATYIGGTGEDSSDDLKVDASGNVYIAGTTQSTNYPVTTGTFDTTYNGGFEDLFLTKLDAAGSALTYSTYVGGSDIDNFGGIAIDTAGNVYLAGSTESSNYPVTVGAVDTTYNGAEDVVVTKFNSAGSALIYSTYIGGNFDDDCFDIVIDSAGNTFITGATGINSSMPDPNLLHYPVTQGAFDGSHNGFFDAYVTQLNATGSALIYSTYIGGPGIDEGNALAIDPVGNAYVTGSTSSDTFPTTSGAFDTTRNGGADLFVTKLGNATTSCSYSLSPTNATIAAAGTTGSFGVETGNGCAWTAVSNAGWITTSSTGSGNGTVSYSVAPNPGGVRSGTITVGGQQFTVNQSASAANCTPPPANLISWYKAEGNAGDVLETNTGLLQNGATFGTGKVGQAFSLDGTNDYVRVADSPSLRPVNLTLEGWVNFTSTSGTRAIFSKSVGSATLDSFAVYYSGGELFGTVGDSVLSGTNRIAAPFNPVVGTWYHIAYTFDDSTNIQVLYINGVAITTGTTPKSMGFDNKPFLIGADNDNGIEGTVPFHGLIDEASIYSRALTANEILTVYNSGSDGKCPPPPSCPSSSYSINPTSTTVSATGGSGSFNVVSTAGCNWSAIASSPWIITTSTGSGNGTVSYTIASNFGAARTGTITVGGQQFTVNQSVYVPACTPPPANLISWYKAEGNAGDVLETNTGLLQNGATFGTGKVGQAFSLDGTNDYVRVADSPSLRPVNLTLEGWFNFSSTSGQRKLFSKAVGNATLDSFAVYYSGGELSGTVGDAVLSGTNRIIAPFNPVVGTWYHIAYTFDDSTNIQVLYINGVAITTGTTPKSMGYDDKPFLIGADNDNGVEGTVPFHGLIDEASIYSRALSANEILTVYSVGSDGKCPPCPPGSICQLKASSTDSLPSDFFGYSVSISENTAVIGAHGQNVNGNEDQGAAYVFVKTGANWELQQKLTMPIADAQATALFGLSVAVSGDTLIVGSPNQDNGSNTDQGAAYVYVRSGTTWTFQQRLRQSDGAVGDNFGWSVAIDGNTAVVGAHLDDDSIYTDCGSAYAFLRTGTTWQEETRMIASDRTSSSQMGHSVGISGETIIVGARFAQSSASSPDFGSAYIFTPVAGTPRIWTQRAILTAPQRGAGDQFGFSVGVSGNTALVGARFDDVGSNVDQGSAFVFTGSGTTWSLQRQLFANDGTANDEFGNAVSINGDRLIVGAPQDASRNGKAYLFTGIGANWSQLPVVVAPDGSPNDLYGSSVSISGSNAVVGAVFDDARRGSVYFLSGIPSAKSKLTADFDGDGKTDLSVFRPANGQWWLGRSTDGLIVHTFGNSSDILTPGDFTGDGKSDVSIFRPSSGEWFVLRSEDSSFYSFPFGTNGDVPVPADYDGDGKTDAAVFRSSNSTWYIQRSSGGTTIQGFGVSGDRPVPADYDGDGKADIAVFRPSLGQWWLNRSTAGGIAVTFGSATDRTVQGDYTGDGKTDIAIWRPSNGEWFILRSEDFTFYSFPFGAGGDTPAPGDYDGDGKTDAAVFRPSNSTWYVQRSTAGTLIQGFGLPPDLPVPSAYVR